MSSPTLVFRRSPWAAVLVAAAFLALCFPLSHTTAQDSAASDSGAIEAAAPAAGAGIPAADLRPSSEVGLVEWFRRGGVFMWPLLACSIAALAVILERLFTMQRARTHTRRFMNRLLTALREKGVEEALEICTRTRGPVASILHSGLLKAEKGTEAVEKAIETAGVLEMSFLQRGLIVLASVTTIAPLLGFLGTVSGMIHAFDAIAQAEQVTAQLVASGVREALITTAAGLMVAIPAQIFYHYFLTRIDRFVSEMEEASAELVDVLAERQSRRGLAV